MLAARATLSLLVRQIFDCAAWLVPLPEEQNRALNERAMRENGFKKADIAREATLPAQSVETTRKGADRRDARHKIEKYAEAARGMVRGAVGRAVRAAGGVDSPRGAKILTLAKDFLDPKRTYVEQIARAWYILHNSGFEIGAGDLDRDPGPSFPAVEGSKQLAKKGLLAPADFMMPGW